MKYDPSLLEVLRWKEEVSAFLQNLTIQERLKKIREMAAKIRSCNSNERESPTKISQSANVTL